MVVATARVEAERVVAKVEEGKEVVGMARVEAARVVARWEEAPGARVAAVRV